MMRIRTVAAFAFGAVFLAASALAWGAHVERTTGWSILTDEAEFGPRDSAHGFVFNDKFWLSNGYFHGNVLIRDLWRSKDGSRWQLVSKATPYDGYSAMTVIDNKPTAVMSSSWQSTDGIKWSKVADGLKASGIVNLAVLDGVIYYIDGRRVFKSPDGINWEGLTSTAPFQIRNGAALVELNGHLLLIAGSTPLPNSKERGYNDRRTLAGVWQSTDGATWERIITDAPFGRRMWHSVAVADGVLYLFGGFDNVNNVNLGDLWMTRDGRHWRKIDRPGGPSPRHYATMYPSGRGFILAAGNAWPVQNDVWRFDAARWPFDEALRKLWLDMAGYVRGT